MSTLFTSKELEGDLSDPTPTPFSLGKLERHLENVPGLQAYTIGHVWCYRAGVHEFLLFQIYPPQLGSPLPEKDIWLRMERAPEPAGVMSLPSSKTLPATDTFMMNYNKGVLMAYKLKKHKPMGGLSLIRDQKSRMSINHIVSLAKIVHDVSETWSLLGTNCRWFCAVTMHVIKAHFRHWTMVEFVSGYLEFRGSESRPAQRVRELYHLEWNIHNLIYPTNVAAAIVGVSLGLTSFPERSVPQQTKPETRRAQDLWSMVQNRADVFPRIVEVEPRLEALVDILLRDDANENAQHIFMWLQLIENPDDVWGCFCNKLKVVFNRDDLEATRRVIENVIEWAKTCRLPFEIRSEVKALHYWCGTIPGLEDMSSQLLNELKPMMMFALVDQRPAPDIAESIFNISPESMANILGHIEVKIRERYLISEVATMYAWKSQQMRNAGKVPNQTVAPFYDMVLVWVKSCILFRNTDKKGTEERIKAIKYFIEVAQECHKHNNLSTTHSIMDSLHDLNISQFKITSSEMGRKELRSIEKLRSETSHHTSHKHWHFWTPSQSTAKYINPLSLELHKGLLNEVTEYRMNRKKDPPAELEDHGSSLGMFLNNLLPKNLLEEHGMKPREIQQGLEMCVCGVWLLIEQAHSKRHELDNLEDVLSDLRMQEMIEREVNRSVVLF